MNNMTENKKIGWKKYISILTLILLLFLFYRIGIPLYFIFVIGIVILLLVLLKGKLYTKIDDFLRKKFPILSKQKPWVRKLIIIAIFILIYVLLKQVVFMILKIFGVDVQQIILDSINQSIK